MLHDGAMETALVASDLLLGRAGASTIAELAAAGVASVLVPFPHAVDDHQTHNARFLAGRGAAVLIPQNELTPQKLAELLRGFTREVLAIASWAAAAVAAYYFYPMGVPYIQPYAGGKDQIAMGVSAAAIFFVTLIIVSIITATFIYEVLDLAVITQCGHIRVPQFVFT